MVQRSHISLRRETELPNDQLFCLPLPAQSGIWIVAPGEKSFMAQLNLI